MSWADRQAAYDEVIPLSMRESRTDRGLKAATDAIRMFATSYGAWWPYA